MFMGLGMPIPDLSNKPGPGRPGWGPIGSYDFQFRVEGTEAVVIKANAAGAGNFRISWPNGTTQVLSGNNASITAPDATDGIVSINNEKLDTTYCDEFAVIGGKGVVREVISWGKNPWSNMYLAFDGCTSLSDISTTSFISSSNQAIANKSMIKMFNGCTSLLEADIRNWNLTAGVDWDGGSPFNGLVNLQKLDMTGMSIKILTRGTSAFAGIGTAVTNGCEFLMSGIDWSTTTGTIWQDFFASTKINPNSDLSNWVFPSLSISLNRFFRGGSLAGVNSTLNMSGWSTLSTNGFYQFFQNFNSADSPDTDQGMRINISNINVSDADYFPSMFEGCDVTEIIGLSTLGASSATNANLSKFADSARFLKFSSSDNFSNAFIASLNPSNVSEAFQYCGAGLSSSFGVAPNLTNINLSNVTSLSSTFEGARFYDAPDLSTATFPSTGVSFFKTFKSMRTENSTSHVDFSNVSVKISNAREMFTVSYVNSITFGNNVDFSLCTDVYRKLYQVNYPNTVNITYPTAESGLSWAALTQPLQWFTSTTGPTTGPLTTCQVDNLIRSFHNTALNSGLTVDFGLSKITESPSVVSTMVDELENTGGWNITPNTLDATIPFVYTGSFLINTDITPTINTSETGAFSSSDVTVNATTGTFNTSTAGSVTIRYTITATGCYNEQVLSVVPPFTPFKFRVTGPISIKAQPAVAGQNFTIDWGDGSTPVSTTGGASIPSNFTTAGTYDVQINAEGDNTYCDEFAIVSGQTNVTEVLDWGENPWTSLSFAFLNCTNLTDISTTSLITGSGCALSSAFKSCTSLTDVNISSWDMANPAVIDEMFMLCTGLEVFQATNLNVNGGSRWWLRDTGTAVTDGCEYRLNGLNITATSFGAPNMTQWWLNMKINPASSFANISWPNSGTLHSGASFQGSSITGVNSTLDCSGWTNYNSGIFPSFHSFTATEGGTSNMKIDITNLNVSTVVSFNRSFLSTHASEVVGLGGLGATNGATNMEYAFLSAAYMKFDNHNFSSNFINSFNLGISNFIQVFQGCGSAYSIQNASTPPNLHSLDLSSATSLNSVFSSAKFSSAPDFSNVTMSPTATYNFIGTFTSMQVNDNSNVNSLFSKTFKVGSFSSAFQNSALSSITIGSGVDFSPCTTMTRAFQQTSSSTNIELPTNMDLGNITGVNGFQYTFLLGSTLSTCQVDNFIRRLHATALTNGLAIDFNNAAVTESPSIVRGLLDNLENPNGWSITVNTTDATIPFEYTGDLEPDTNINPTNNTGSAFTGTFTSSNSNIAVNATTGVINTPNGGNTTIRYTLDDGCYTEQAIVIESPMLSVWRTTTPSESVSIVGPVLGNTDSPIYYDFTIDWGDSSSVESYSDTAGQSISHTYATAGDHEVKISGKYPGLDCDANSDKTKLIEFKQWGTCIIRSFPGMFNGCTNMTYTATDSPTWNGTLTTRGFDYVFRNCSSITSLNLSNWSSSMLGYAWNNLYARSVFNGCTNVEQITLPTGINASTVSHDSMFQNCGTATTDGVEITWTNYTNGRNSTSFNSFINSSKMKFANLTYWTVNAASLHYFLRSSVDVVGNYIDMSNWTTTGNGLSSFYIRTGKVDEIRMNNWSANMTQNISSLSHAWYTSDVEKIIGLENWNFNGVTTMLNWLTGVSKLSFSTGRNFGTNSMTSGNLQAMTYAFNGVGGSLSSTQQADSYAPNISNWNTSGVNSFTGVFYNSVFNLNDVDISNWDFSSATTLGVMFRQYNRNAVSRGTRTYEAVISNLSSSCTSLGSMCRESAVTDIDLRGSDLSGITNIDHFWLSSYAPSGHIKRFRIDTNADLNSVSNMGNFAGTIHTDDYDLLLTRLEATNNNTSVSMAMSASKYSAGLIFPDVRNRSMTDTTTANKIVDENADFVELGVSVNDIVETRNGNNYYYAKVSAVNSSTELTLDANIVLSGRTYNVQTSNAAKARYDLDITQSWLVSDGGPVIE